MPEMLAPTARADRPGPGRIGRPRSPTAASPAAPGAWWSATSRPRRTSAARSRWSGRRLDHDRRAPAAAAAQGRRRRDRARGAPRGARRRRATRAACSPSSRRTRRARAAARCSTATDVGPGAGPHAAALQRCCFWRLAARARVHAERDEVFLAPVGLLLLPSAPSRAACSGRTCRTRSTRARRTRTARRTSRGRRRTPSSRCRSAPMPARLRAISTTPMRTNSMQFLPARGAAAAALGVNRASRVAVMLMVAERRSPRHPGTA